MVAYNDHTPFEKSWPRWRLLLTGLTTLALVLSTLMSWHYLIGVSMPGCGGGSPCEQVLNSRWSTLAGLLPVSGLAVGAYLALLVSGLYIGPTTDLSVRRLAWSAMLILSGSIAGSAVWFTIVQKWLIGDFCPYCMTTHITGLLLAALIFRCAITKSGNAYNDIPSKNPNMRKSSSTPDQGSLFSPLKAVGLLFSGLALAAMLAAFQGFITPPATYSDGKSQNNLPAIDVHNAPVIGSPDAPYVVTLLFDYQCSHCQKLHLILNEAVRRYAGKLAFVLCPAPLNRQCNPYVPQDVDAFKNSCELARIGMAVWVANREAFPAFENWMFTFESGDSWRPRSLENVRARAIELVGQDKLDAALANPWIATYMQTSMQIFGQTLLNGKGGVPKLIFGTRWVIPERYNTDELMLILQKSLGVPKT